MALVVPSASCRVVSPDVLHPDLDLFDIGSQQRQRRQRGRTDREPFTGGGRRITERIQRIGAFAHIRIESAHFGVTARIVGDRAVSVGRQRNPERREHPHRRDTDPIKPFC